MNTATKNEFSFNTVDLLESSAGLLFDYLLRPSKHDGKMRFKKISETEQQFVASMPTNEGGTANIHLRLDSSEYRGLLNFNIFKQFLSHLVGLIAQALKEGSELSLRPAEGEQRFLLDLPAALEIEDQLNVMMLGFNLEKENEITLELLFFEPKQFQK